MTLFSDNELAKLRANNEPERHGRDLPPVARAILPGSGCAWLFTEILPEQNERFALGLADYGMGNVHEGRIDLRALALMAVPLASDKYRVQRDPAFSAEHSISVYWLAAQMYGYLTNDPEHLADARQFLAEQLERTITVVPQHAGFPKPKPA